MTKPTDTQKTSKIIHRILRTAQLIDAFWERWIVHGIDKADIQAVQKELSSYENWIAAWNRLAEEKLAKAVLYKQNKLFDKAERMYRQTGLYYNLIYWLDPERTEEKMKWSQQSLSMTMKADALSSIACFYKTITINGVACKGRIRVPSMPKGCIVIINPIDSSKEELYKYEKDFIDRGFATVSFDGPGQGETFMINGKYGSRHLWEQFIDQVISVSDLLFPNLPIYLFGTSLGGSWVIYGSAHPRVSRAAAVSPAVALEKMNMPGYFMERMNCSCFIDKSVHPIPAFEKITGHCPVLIFHGNKDMMVPNKEMKALYQQLPKTARMITYKDAGHCCNFYLDDIRKLSVDWFIEKKKIGASERI